MESSYYEISLTFGSRQNGAGHKYEVTMKAIKLTDDDPKTIERLLFYMNTNDYHDAASLMTIKTFNHDLS